MTRYQVSAEAQNDLFEIWQRIAQDSVELANRIEGEFYSLFESLARMPRQGHSRKDLTQRARLILPALFVPRRIPAGGEADSHHGGALRHAKCETHLERPAMTETNDPRP